MDTNELFNAIKMLESEKNIKRESLFEAIKVSLVNACKTYFGTAENISVNINPDTCELHVIAAKKVVEDVEDDALEMDLEEAREIDSHFEIEMRECSSFKVQPFTYSKVSVCSS